MALMEEPKFLNFSTKKAKHWRKVLREGIQDAQKWVANSNIICRRQSQNFSGSITRKN